MLGWFIRNKRITFESGKLAHVDIIPEAWARMVAPKLIQPRNADNSTMCLNLVSLSNNPLRQSHLLPFANGWDSRGTWENFLSD
jgi:hypothetical protein